MMIIPAVDIQDGKVVRLYKGDFNRQTVYSDDPVEVAQMWQRQGASMLHIVDLDGARTGRVWIIRIIETLVKSVTIPIQVGGGVRSEAVITCLFKVGVARVVIGTAAYDNRDFLKRVLDRYGNKIAVAIDVKGARLVKKGWRDEVGGSFADAASGLQSLGATRFVYTDTQRDGTLKGFNLDIFKRLLKKVDVKLLVAGGISSMRDIKNLKDLGVEGVIIGKALYEGRVNLKEAIAYAS